MAGRIRVSTSLILTDKLQLIYELGENSTFKNDLNNSVYCSVVPLERPPHDSSSFSSGGGEVSEIR